jgi:hypothetical protein
MHRPERASAAVLLEGFEIELTFLAPVNALIEVFNQHPEERREPEDKEDFEYREFHGISSTA